MKRIISIFLALALGCFAQTSPTVGGSFSAGAITPGPASGGAASYSSITNTGLTPTRVVFSGVGGLETDAAAFTFIVGTGNLASTIFTGDVIQTGTAQTGSVPGSLRYHATYGTYLQGRTGVTNDLTLITAANGLLLSNPTGTNSLTTGGNLTVTGTLSATTTITPGQTQGIVGTTTNNNVQAGSVGEYVTATVATGASVTLTTATTATVTSISLTAGDWDVWGVVDYTAGATTSITNQRQGVSTTAATLGGQDTFTSLSYAAMIPTAAIDEANAVPVQRLSLAGTTTVYLVANSTFTVSTLKAYGSVFARRVR